ncbi:MAG: hypothetical protein ACRC0J_09190, partial [Shewanella oncorhynchi]
MAERIKPLWPAATWELTKKQEILFMILKQIILPATLKHIEGEQLKYLKTGTQLKYDAVLDLIETYETSRDKVPNKDTQLTVNVCSGTINNALLNERRQSQNKKQYKTMSVEPMDTHENAKKQLPPISPQKKRKFGENETTPAFAPPNAGIIHKNPNNGPRAPNRPPGQQQNQIHTPKGPPIRVYTHNGDNATKMPRPYEKPNFQFPRNNNPHNERSKPQANAGETQNRPNYEPKQNNNYANKNNYSQNANNYNRSNGYNSNYRNYNNYGYRNQSPQRYNNYSNTNYRGIRSYNGNNYRNNYSYRGGQRGGQNRAPQYNQRQETDEERTKRLAPYFCPDCKHRHKIAAFCPNTGVPANTQHLNAKGPNEPLRARAYNYQD